MMKVSSKMHTAHWTYRLGTFERFVRDRAARDLFSGSVLLAHRGRPVLRKAYGEANKEKQIPNRPDTLFDLASVTKTFTAVAIGQLVQCGKLALHGTLGEYLDGFPTEIAEGVTIHHLLTHTSGVGRPPLNPEPPPGSDNWDSVEDVWNGTMTYIRSLPLQFTPGARWAYSNDGFFVLGAIVAAVSGLSYYDYVRTHVFAPAGMRRTGFYTKPQVLARDDIARPYATQPSGERVDATTTEHFRYVGGPDGGAYSTGPELLRFFRALYAKDLLKPGFLAALTSEKVPTPPRDDDGLPAQSVFYGYGFSVSIVNGVRIAGHSGGAPGVDNNAECFVDLDWMAVVLGNYDKSADPVVGLARQILTT